MPALSISRRPAADADADAADVSFIVAVVWGRKRYTRAELVRAENQVRKERQSSHGPIVSVRWGSGWRKCLTILNASEGNSTTLLSRDITGEAGVGREKKGGGGQPDSLFSWGDVEGEAEDLQGARGQIVDQRAM